MYNHSYLGSFYCWVLPSAWCRSAYTCVIDKPIIDTSRIVAGWPASHSNGQSLCSSWDPTNWASPPKSHAVPSSPRPGPRTSPPRKPCVPILWASGQLKFVTPIYACNTGIAERSCLIRQQCSKMSRLQMEHGVTKKHFVAPIADLSEAPLEMFFPRPACVRLNCLRIGVGLFRSKMHK